MRQILPSIIPDQYATRHQASRDSNVPLAASSKGNLPSPAPGTRTLTDDLHALNFDHQYRSNVDSIDDDAPFLAAQRFIVFLQRLNTRFITSISLDLSLYSYPPTPLANSYSRESWDCALTSSLQSLTICLKVLLIFSCE